MKQNSGAWCSQQVSDRGHFPEICLRGQRDAALEQPCESCPQCSRNCFFSPFRRPCCLLAVNQAGAGRSSSGLSAMGDWDILLNGAAHPGAYTGGTGISSESRGEAFVSTDFGEHLFCFICSDCAF